MAETIGRKQLEIMAAACCYAGFSGDYQGKTPAAYWRDVKPEARKFYYCQAEAVIALVRHMPTVKP